MIPDWRILIGHYTCKDFRISVSIIRISVQSSETRDSSIINRIYSLSGFQDSCIITFSGFIHYSESVLIWLISECIHYQDFRIHLFKIPGFIHYQHFWIYTLSGVLEFIHYQSFRIYSLSEFIHYQSFRMYPLPGVKGFIPYQEF